MIKTIGTVLPTKASLAVNDAYARRVARDKERIAEKKLNGCTRRVVGGEVRYYDTADQYAIVSRQGAVLWFAVTDDGDRRI
jgi:hypothetical protein